MAKKNKLIPTDFVLTPSDELEKTLDTEDLIALAQEELVASGNQINNIQEELPAQGLGANPSREERRNGNSMEELNQEAMIVIFNNETKTFDKAIVRYSLISGKAEIGHITKGHTNALVPIKELFTYYVDKLVVRKVK